MSLRAGTQERGSDVKPAQAVATRRENWLLAVCCVAQFMVILDLSIVNVALPSIQVSLGFSAIELQWVVEAYAIAFAGFLMFGGRASDHFGQRRTLIAALLIFAVASLLGGSAPDQTVLVLARALQGFGGALMAAGSLAAITATFQPGPALHRAIALWAAMNGAGGAAGTLFGGVITQGLGWRWVLLINPPIGIAAAIVAYFVVGDRRRERQGGFDVGGAVALTAGLVVLVFGIVNAGYLGWTALAAIGPIVLGIVLLALFVLIEARFASDPLVPLKALTSPLRTANGIVLLFSAALFPMWYVGSLYLQQVLGLSPLETGLAFLPMALTIMVSARRAGGLVNRYGVRAVLTGGLLMMACGLLLFSRIGSSGSAIAYIIVPGVLVALGIGLSVVPSTIAATQAAGAQQAGLASGLVNTARQMGGALGVAVLVSLATQYTSHLIDENRAVADSLTDGFRIAYLIGAGLCVAAALVTFARLPRQVTAPGTEASGRLRRLRLGFPAVAAVAVVGFTVINLATAGAPAAPIGAYTTAGTYSFVSAPGLHPPKITSTVAPDTSSLAPGYILLTNFYNVVAPPMVGQSGPLILDDQLQPVWFQPVPTGVIASNLSLQTFDGKPALAWWQGVISSTGATESGEDVVVNQHYQVVARLHGQDGWVITLHSLQIQGDDAWVTANKNITMNLTKYGGVKDGALTDSAVQEYNLKTGKLVYSWDALAHIPLSDSKAPPPVNGFPWDAYHVNAIDLEAGGGFLVSMRNTWAAYQVQASTGRILWTLGGKQSSFRFGPGASFEWQHDVSLAVNNSTDPVVTMFDDECCEITGAGTYLAPAAPSRGLVLRLDLADHSATVVRQYAEGGYDAAYMGDLELLPNGNAFVGWGAAPYFSEFDKAGKLVLQGQFPSPDETYRATLEPWVGLPETPPSAAARPSGRADTVYASWNGATQVTSWRVLAGQSSASLAVVATSARTGFETRIPLSTSYHVLKVEALNSAGHVIGTSASFSPHS